MVSDSSFHVRLPDDFEPEHLNQHLSGRFAFIADLPNSARWVFYDTFDWRLFNLSLVLRHTGQELVLERLSSRERINQPAGDSAPRFAWDLPFSPLRERLESIIKMRALLPIGEVDTRTMVYRILNADEKTVARLILTEARTHDQAGEAVIGSFLSLQPVRGYPKHTRRLANHLRRMPKVSSVPSVLQELLPMAVESSGKTPGSYSGSFDLQLEPMQRSDSAAREILRHLLKTITANEAGIVADIDTEYLHDYRIAIRRTRSALSQIRGVFPAEETEYFEQSFRTLGQLTNDLRDLDVYLLSEAEFEARLPEAMADDIVPLFDYLRQLRKGAVEEVVTGLSSAEYARTIAEWGQFLDQSPTKETEAANAAVPMVVLARRRIYKRYRRIIKDGNYILAHMQDDLLHALRIECKKLRYLMEFFGSLFPPKKMARLLKQLRRLQDNLGQFNDLAVQQEYLMQIAEKLPMDDPRSRKALVATGYLVENLSYSQQAVKANFAKTFKEFASPANQKLFRRLFSAKGKRAGR